MVIKSVGFDLSLEQFLAQKDRFNFVTFDPTDQPTPEPLKADLAWIWAILLPFVLLIGIGLVIKKMAHGEPGLISNSDKNKPEPDRSIRNG